MNQKRIKTKETKLEVSLELDEFFNRTNDQITRITSNQKSKFIPNDSQLKLRFVQNKNLCLS